MRNDVEEIKARVVEDEAGCWIWQRALKQCRRGTHRYGWVAFRGTQMAAHRASWIIFRGEIPPGLVVCHVCDVPACVNPGHLFLGTQRDNAQDMFCKGRNRVGNAKKISDGLPVGSVLTKEDLERIPTLRSSGLSYRAIAKVIGVGATTIYDFLAGVTHVK